MADLTGMMQAAAAGGEEPYVPINIQEVFNTTLYNGNSSTNVITTNLDFLNRGGLALLQSRSTAAADGRCCVSDTVRGMGNRLLMSTTGAQDVYGATFVSNPTTTSYTLGNLASSNYSGESFASWNFCIKSKFFSAISYTGNGVAGRTIAHDLKSAPGMVIIKKSSATGTWPVWHQGIYDIDPDGALLINGTSASTSYTGNVYFGTGSGNTIPPTASSFTVGNDTAVNASGATYIAYLFANNAGGFGPDGTDNVITCGYYTGNGSATGPTVTLGYQPNWLLTRAIDNATNWRVWDGVRSPSNPRTRCMFLNAAIGDLTGVDMDFNATSFQVKSSSGEVNNNGSRYLYVAIRAPM